jgi:large subunit ribosomal protein L11
MSLLYGCGRYSSSITGIHQAKTLKNPIVKIDKKKKYPKKRSYRYPNSGQSTLDTVKTDGWTSIHSPGSIPVLDTRWTTTIATTSCTSIREKSKPVFIRKKHETMSFVRYVNLRVPAGSAKPGPAIGQALGPLGINMAEFCKQFNEKSEKVYKKDIPLRVRLHANSDRSFTFDMRTPTTSYLIKKAVGLEKGPTNPDPTNPIAYITPEMVYEISKIKQSDDMRWHIPLESIARSVVGQARTMGITCREATDEE